MKPALLIALALATSCAPQLATLRRQFASPRWLVDCPAAAGVGRACAERPQVRRLLKKPSPPSVPPG